MANVVFYIAALVVVIAVSNAQQIMFGNCPKVSLQQNFEPAKYFNGTFYEQKRFWAIFEIGSKCVNAEYTAKDDGTVKVNNSGFSLKKKTRFSQVGEAYCEKDETAACHVRFYPGTPYGNYNLLSADPEKYGLVFSCRQVIPGIINTQFAWILTREKTISPKEMDGYMNIFRENGINADKFIDTVQDCPDN